MILAALVSIIVAWSGGPHMPQIPLRCGSQVCAYLRLADFASDGVGILRVSQGHVGGVQTFSDKENGPSADSNPNQTKDSSNPLRGTVSKEWGKRFGALFLGIFGGCGLMGLGARISGSRIPTTFVRFYGGLIIGLFLATLWVAYWFPWFAFGRGW